MKRKPFYLILIAVLVLIAVVVWYGKPAIVPKDVVIDDNDTTYSLPGNFIFIEPEPYFEQARLNTGDTLIIYDPQVTVRWDTLR